MGRIDHNLLELPVAELQQMDASAVLRWSKDKFPSIVFSSALGAEDQVITHLIASEKLGVEIISLETGRLFAETLQLWRETEAKYNLKIKALHPDSLSVDEMVKAHGQDLFKDSVELRKKCCSVRKIVPLKQELLSKEAWITGIRREQNENRRETNVIEWDESFGLLKVNPLWNWSEKQVWDFIRTNNIPYNRLHDQNFASIGCAPCTRAIAPGEHPRKGRWWWEDSQKECGLHLKDGKLQRIEK